MSFYLFIAILCAKILCVYNCLWWIFVWIIKPEPNLILYWTLSIDLIEDCVCYYHMTVNFTNILWLAFACTVPKSAKKTDGLTVHFLLLESVCLKAVGKMLIKLTPDRCWGAVVGVSLLEIILY